MIPVHTLTANATQDDRTEEDYREIFEELREKYSLRMLEGLLASIYTYGTWDRYAKGEWALTRQAKNELRRAVGLVVLPPTVAEAMADVDEDAEVYAIGDKPKNRVFLASHGQSLTVYANGVVTAQEGPCTGRTRDTRKRLRREMTAGQAEAWDKLTAAERNERLGL